MKRIGVLNTCAFTTLEFIVILPAVLVLVVKTSPSPLRPLLGSLGSQFGCWNVYAPASAVSKRNEATSRRLSKMIGDTAPTGPLKVATSWLSALTAGLIAPGAAPPVQFVPVVHNPSPPAPVHVWLAAIALVAVIADAIAAIVEITLAPRRSCCFFVRSIVNCIEPSRLQPECVNNGDVLRKEWP